MQLLTKDLGRRALRRSRPPGRSKKSTVGVGAAALGHSSSVSDFAASALHRAWAGCACCASSGFEREPRLFESGLLQPGRATTNLTRLAAHGQATRLWAEHCGSIGSVADNKFTLLWVQLHTDSGMAEASRGLGPGTSRDFQGLCRAPQRLVGGTFGTTSDVLKMRQALGTFALGNIEEFQGRKPPRARELHEFIVSSGHTSAANSRCSKSQAKWSESQAAADGETFPAAKPQACTQ